MATFNTSAIMVAAHKAAAHMHKVTRTSNNGWGYGKTYRQIFATYLRQEWASERTINAKMSQKVETFMIRIDYSDTRSRSAVKLLNGRWNAENKVWTVTCQLHSLGTLAAKIVSAKNSNAGYMGKPVNFMRTRAGYEFDGIENA